MKRLGWRAGIAAALMVVAFVFLVPSMTQELPAWWSGVLPKDKIHLGLDLQGGVHLILEVEVKKAAESYLERVVEDLKPDLRKNKIRALDLKRRGIDGIELILAPDQEAKDLETLVGSNYPSFKLEPGARDEKGRTYFLSLIEQERTQIFKMAADQALETIRNRIDQFGVTEPDIRPQTGHRILIQLPGIKDPKRAIDLIGKTARLEFKLVDEEYSLEEALKGNVPAGSEILHEAAVDRKTGRKTNVPYLLKKRAPLTGESITDARVQLDNQMGEPYVSLSFDSRGARVFERITGDNVGKRLAIVLDDKVYSAPVIRDKISGGKAQITGAFTMDDAKDLAIVLRAGALPAPVKILEERTVGPSLGKDSIDQGFNSMVIGRNHRSYLGGLLLPSFRLHCRCNALLLNIPFIMGGLALFGATLTLPGHCRDHPDHRHVRGCQCAHLRADPRGTEIGQTRTRRYGSGICKGVRDHSGLERDDGDCRPGLAQFGTGPVKGFAVTLIIGLVSNVLTAVFMAESSFDYLYVYKRWKTISI